MILNELKKLFEAPKSDISIPSNEIEDYLIKKNKKKEDVDDVKSWKNRPDTDQPVAGSDQPLKGVMGSVNKEQSKERRDKSMAADKAIDTDLDTF